VGFVVGLPLHADGAASTMSTEAERFGAWLGRATGLPVVFQDERYTSHEAAGMLGGVGLSRGAKKSMSDAVAAQVILRSWMDSQKAIAEKRIPVRLVVGPGVFTPRPETESRLEWAQAQNLGTSPVIVDLCTGSGALALALAAGRPAARVIAVDDDPVALGYARRNAEGSTVEVVAADVTAAGLLPALSCGVDLVVANPPYLPAGCDLEPEVALGDPPHALYGGSAGMALIGPIAAHAARWLRPGGLLAVEHDDTTASATVEVVSATGAFGEVTPRRDLTGRPRFVTARRSGGGPVR
jgi:release factor glutamine methyltransferase